MSRQNDVEHLKDLMQKGELTVDQANVQMVRDERFRLVVNSLPAEVRKALNAAVKAGDLGRMAKDGHKPECYFHPTFRYLAVAARAQRENEIRRLSGTALVCMSEVEAARQ